MDKLINRDEAILELAKGNIVSWNPTTGSWGKVYYKMINGKLNANKEFVGFDFLGKEYSVVDIYDSEVPLLNFTTRGHNKEFRRVQDLVIREMLTLKITEKKQDTKLNGQGKAVTAQLIKSLSEVFGVKDQVFKVEPVKLYRLGNYVLPVKGTIEDLSEYFIDEDGDLYSKNDDTYFTKYGVVLTKLSNSARDNSLRVVNSLRAKSGNKVTIARDKLVSMRNRGELEDVTMLPNSVHMIHMPSGDEVRTSDFAL